jgi:hypothetical protein
MAVDQRVTQREVLCQAHHGVICRNVAMWVKFTKHLTHYTRRFDRFGARPQTHLMHGKQNASLNRFLPVTDVRQGPSFYYRNGVFKVGPLGV